jgi:hypothetical protein
MTTRVQFSFNTSEPEDDTSGVQAHEDLTSTVTATNAFGNTGHRVQLGGKDDIDDLALAADVGPFTSAAEMQAALEAKTTDGATRIFVDPVYRRAVEARIAQAMGPGTGRERFAATFHGEATNAPLRLLNQNQQTNELMISDGVNRSGIQPFASEEAMIAAISDPRYRTDASYRAEVDARVAVS